MIRRHLYRDKDLARRTCNKQMKRYYHKTINAKNSRQPWTEDDMELVMKHEITDHELSEKIGRSVQAIQMKRHRMMEERYGYERE